MNRRNVLAGMLGGSVMALSGGTAALSIRLALQEGGTASWELAAMRAAGLDVQNGVAVDLRGAADGRATQVALQAGAVDAILSDFIWVSRQRHQGADFAFVPHSLAVGGLMVDPAGPVRTVADLQGRTLAVAGGPADKSYILLQAWFAAQTGKHLPDVITAEFGAPPLVNEMLVQGRAQAALNFWHFNVRAGLAGMTELLPVRDMLAGLGVQRTPPLLGWVFSEQVAVDKARALRRFLAASVATKRLLLDDDAIWDTIRPGMAGAAQDDALFVALRQAYRAGIVTSTGEADRQAAAETFALIAKFGGPDVVGDQPALAPGTFWSGTGA